MNEDELLKQLFDIVRAFTISAGGDGEGWIISPRYKDLSYLFELHEGQLPDPHFIVKTEHQNTIVYEGNMSQDAILFVPDRGGLPPDPLTWPCDIIVEIP